MIFLFSKLNSCLLVCILVFGCFLAGCISSEYNVGTQSQDIYLFSTEREVAMGRNIAKKIAEEFKISKNPLDIRRIEEISSRLVEVVDRREITYYFYVIEEDNKQKSQINAFAVPGGYVYIFKELFDLLDDDQLGFVLAHEIAHIVSRHSIKRLQAALGYNLLVVASAGSRSDPRFTQGLSLALAQILVGYSREDELNADELAVKYCQLAGFKAIAGIEVQEKLYSEGKKRIRPLSYFRTHPYTDQRIRRIKEVLRLPLDVDDYINY